MKVSFQTLGCKVNKYESEGMMQSFKEKGFSVTENLEYADFFVINSCAVTGEAEKKSRQMVARCRKFNPNAKIFVCGCASEKSFEQFASGNVEVVKGVAGKSKMIEYIQSQGVFVDDIQEEFEEFLNFEKNKTRAYIKIQDGCNNFCSYCIIPYLRGRSRSRKLENILDEVKSLPDTVKEIVFTGINISDFKIEGENGLLALIQKCDSFGKRLRLGSLEECIIDEEFVKGVSILKNFCPHFHLSLQSGCDSVLKRMNRHYLTRDFEKSVNIIRKYFPNAGITTDVIVGFPNETEEEFEETFAFLKKMKFSSMHIFQYSKRDGTASSKMNDLPSQIKKERAQLLQDLNEKMQKEFFEQNKEYSLLVEEFDGNFFVGHSKNFVKIFVEKESGLKVGDVAFISFEKAFNDGILGKVKSMNENL